VPDPGIGQLPAFLGPPHGVGEAQVGVADHAEHVRDPERDQRLHQHVRHRPHVRRGGGQADVDPRPPAGLPRRRPPRRKPLRRPAGQRVVVIPVPGTAQPAVLDRALAQRAALMRAPVLQRGQSRAAPGERDRAAVYGNAADPALSRDVYRIDPVPAASSHA